MRIVRTSAYARAGVLGNPSDGFFGRTIAVAFRNFSADVVVYDWPELEIVLSRQDRCVFDRLDDLVQDVRLHGYYGGLRLVKAALKRFAEHCREAGVALPEANFSLRYDTNIPRQVGLAGSSAIITATVRALMEFHGIAIPLEVLPSLVLSVETREIGIAAGLQDRVAQVYGGLTYMDFDREHLERLGHGIYEPLDPALLPPLFIAYRTDLSEVSGVVHGSLRARWEAGEPAVVEAMRHLADITREGRSCLLSGDHVGLARLIDENFDTRARILQLDPRNVEMVRLARRFGAPAHYAGSGGSILGICDEGQFLRMRPEFEAIGCRLIRPTVA